VYGVLARIFPTSTKVAEKPPQFQNTVEYTSYPSSYHICHLQIISKEFFENQFSEFLENVGFSDVFIK